MIKKTIYLVLSVIVLNSCKGVNAYNAYINSQHEINDLKNDIDLAYKKLQKLHPLLYQYISKEKLDNTFDSLKTSINKPLTSNEFYKKIAPVLAEVKQGHLSVSPPYMRFKVKEYKAIKRKTFEFYDLDLEFFEDSLWITSTQGDSTLIGTQILKIEGESIKTLIKKYKTWFASDGYNKTLHNRFVTKHFSSFYYKDKGYKDSLMITLKDKDYVFKRTLRRVKKDSVSTKAKDNQKHKLALTRKQKRIIQKKDKKYGYINSRKTYTRNFNRMGKDSNIAYVKIRSFSNGVYKDFYKETFQTIKTIKAKALILDLRDNPGGNLAEINLLYSYLTNKEYQFLKPSEVKTRLPVLKAVMSKTNPAIIKVLSGITSPIFIVHNLIKTKKEDGKLYYKLSGSKLKQPNSLNYKGVIYVIINGNSFSASSTLSAHLQATKRALFVGEETGGSYNGTVAGLYKIVELPTSKVKIRIGLMQIETPYNQKPNGYGIKPDKIIVPTLKDRLSKNDPELEWILQTIDSKAEYGN